MQEANQVYEKPRSLPGFLCKVSFYPLEYALMLVASLLMGFSASGLGAILISHWAGVSHGLPEMSVLLFVAVLAVSLPAHLILYWRVRCVDIRGLTTLAIRWANAMLAVYVFVLAAAVLALGVMLIVSWLNVPFGAGQVDKNLLVFTASVIQAALWFKLSAFYFLGVRSGRARDLLYSCVVLVVGVAVLALSLVFPARAHHDIATDFAKSNDLAQIDSAINSYVDEHGELPANLQVLSGLDDLRYDRSGYSYTAKGGTDLGVFGYELCVDFAKSSDDEPVLPVSFYNHSSGRQCFERFAVSGDKLRESLESYFRGVEDGAKKLEQQIAGFLGRAGSFFGGLVGGVEGQINQLEHYLEGVEGGSEALQKEMQRLENDIVSSAGVSDKLEQDFEAIGKFFHDLFCGLDPQCREG